jgi:hypothetical protein
MTLENTYRWVRIIMFCSTLLTGCANADPSIEQTLVAQNSTLSTQAAAKRATATFAAAQLQITAEFFATQEKGAQDRRLFIVRTLESFGVDTSGVGFITPVIIPPTLLPGQTRVNSGCSVIGGITRIAPTSESQTIPRTSTPDANRVTLPTLDPNAPRLINTSISSAVGDDDCATASASEFAVTTPKLYAVGTAVNFPAGFTVTFTWLRGGKVLLTDAFTWQNPVNGLCVWYFVTPSDFEFLPGTYSVTFESNGAAVASPIAFVLTDLNAVP